MPITQANRVLAINTPLGEDKLLLQRAAITEAIGQLFHVELDLISEDPNLDFNQAIGGNATIRLDMDNRQTRFFNGCINRFVQVDALPGGAHYRATMVPWLWLLTRTSNCRIFQGATVPDIVKDVFRKHGFNDFDEKLSGHYTAWEYCVQYRETDFQFVSRLLEQEGIYYFFEHTNGKHQLILADSPDAHQSVPGYEDLAFNATAHPSGQNFIRTWSHAQEVQPGSYAVNDFNFEKPSTSLAAQSNIALPHANNGFEIYDYPGEYSEQGDGTDYARIRIEELHARQAVAHGSSHARGITVGHTFNLNNAPRRDQNRAYLVTASTLHLNGNTASSGGRHAGEVCTCHFTAQASDKAFRTARNTPKPLVQGPQTAIVVGPAGEEIHTDKYGRVKVQFHWDRYGKGDENASCWMRISQPVSAGKKWGALSIPRVGQEVIVEFLEGDPDLPIITGQVYNAGAMPPYELPLHKTRTTIRTNTVGGGGFNELRFEDKKGHEQIFIHAERNQDVRVKGDSLEFVGHDRHLIVANNQFEAVTGDKHQEVQGDHNQKVGETLSIQVEQNIQKKAGQNIATEAGLEIHVKAGTNLVLEAGASITLKAGGSFVVVNAAGVTISGAQVLINSGGSPGSGAGCSPTAVKAAQTADTADGGEKMQGISRAPARIAPTSISPTTVALRQAAADGTPFCEPCADADAVAKARAIEKAIASGDILKQMELEPVPPPSPTGQYLSSYTPPGGGGEEEDAEQPHDPEEDRRREEALEQAREMEESEFEY